VLDALKALVVPGAPSDIGIQCVTKNRNRDVIPSKPAVCGCNALFNSNTQFSIKLERCCVIAADEDRPILMTTRKGSGNYINAVFVSVSRRSSIKFKDDLLINI
jgi:hypothetical protein